MERFTPVILAFAICMHAVLNACNLVMSIEHSEETRHVTAQGDANALYGSAMDVNIVRYFPTSSTGALITDTTPPLADRRLRFGADHTRYGLRFHLVRPADSAEEATCSHLTAVQYRFGNSPDTPYSRVETIIPGADSGNLIHLRFTIDPAHDDAGRPAGFQLSPPECHEISREELVAEVLPGLHIVPPTRTR